MFQSESSMSNAQAIARFAAAFREREYPTEVVDAAKQCLVDWLGVCLGALDDPAALHVHRIVAAWRSQGNARLLTGGHAAPAMAALVNGTLSHCLDYDDTHIESILHGSGPTWAAALAVGTDRESSERDLLAAFITGFEVGARIGNRGVGVRLNHSGWHATCTLGRFSSAIAAGALIGLRELQIPHALGVAATQVGGLTASIGTMSKPFQVGKAASDGVVAAELAATGFEAATTLLDGERGLLTTLFQDPSARVPPMPFDSGWEITRNSFKPYAACQLTHASIDSARRLAESIGDADVRNVIAFVNPLTLKLAGHTRPSTATEGKFSLAYTVALGLAGHAVTMDDFGDARLRDPRLRDLTSRVVAVPRDDIERTAARVEVTLADGRVLADETKVAYGSVGNPMRWADLETKFMSMAEPVLGNAARDLLGALRDFERPGQLRQVLALLDAPSRDARRAPQAAD